MIVRTDIAFLVLAAPLVFARIALPVGGEDGIPLLFVLALGIALYKAERLISVFPLFVIASIIGYVVALLQSGNPVYASSHIIRQLVFFGFAVVALQASQTRSFAQFINAFLAIGAVTAFTVVIFRVSPGVELLYQRSPLAPLIIGPVVNQTQDVLAFNTLAPDKAGGILYANGNQAAGFYFALALLAALHWRKRALRSVQFWLMIAAFLATGSKTALFFPSIGCFLVAVLFVVQKSRGFWLGVMLVCLSLLPFALAVLYVAADAVSEIATFAVRIQLWTRAIELMPEYVWLGREPGFWEARWGRLGDLYWKFLPPHNYAFELTMFSGFLPVFLLLMQQGTIGVMLYKTLSDQLFNLSCAFLAFTYLMVYSLLENTTFWGDTRAAFVLALVFGKALEDRKFDLPRLVRFRSKQYV